MEKNECGRRGTGNRGQRYRDDHSLPLAHPELHSEYLTTIPQADEFLLHVNWGLRYQVDSGVLHRGFLAGVKII
jgi:hypothetical protein